MKHVSFVLVILFCIHANSSKVKSAEELAREIRLEQEKMATKDESKRAVLADLYKVNKSLQKLNGERSKIEKNLRKASENVAALTMLIQQMDDRLSTQRKHLRDRVKALSKLHGQGYLRVLFGNHSSSDRSMNMRVIRSITERDFRLIKAHKENLSVFKAQKQKLDGQEKKLAALKLNLDGKEKNLGSQVLKKNAMLRTLDSDRILHTTKLKRLRLETNKTAQSAEELKKINAIEDLFTEQIFERKGTLISPVNGRVKLHYGWLPDPDLNTKIRFKGKLLDAERGESVKAIYRGQVVHADAMLGYGKTVVIDHGNHYFSVYANLGEVEVKVGQSLVEGQNIATMGSTAAFFGRGLYFELRHFSDPENPAEWIKLAERK